MSAAKKQRPAGRRTKAWPLYVVTNYYGPADGPTAKHAYYTNHLHTSKSDGAVALDNVLDDALASADAKDGDEVQIIVVKTGRRPFGDRKMRCVAPFTYKREKKA